MTLIEKRFKKILVTTDFSATSATAIERAIQIAKSHGATITLLHVIEKDLFSKIIGKIIPRDIIPSSEAHAKQELESALIRYKKLYLHIDYAVISKGKPALKILQFAKEYKFDLIVIGAHGRYSMSDTFVGTTAEYIAEHTLIPALVVKNTTARPYKKILVLIDFSAASKKVLKYGIHLFSNTKIRLLHVGDYEFDYLLRRETIAQNISKAKLQKLRKAIILYLEVKMDKFIKPYHPHIAKKSYDILLGYPGPTIINEANNLNTDLIIMGTKGHGKQQHLFMGSVANRILIDANKDVLLIPPTTK